MSSLALIAAGVEPGRDVAVALAGGHGELFVQQFDGDSRLAMGDVANLPPAAAAAAITAELVVGSGARALVEARGLGEAREALAVRRRCPQAARTAAQPAAQARSTAVRPTRGFRRPPDGHARVGEDVFIERGSPTTWMPSWP